MMQGQNVQLLVMSCSVNINVVLPLITSYPIDVSGVIIKPGGYQCISCHMSRSCKQQIYKLRVVSMDLKQNACYINVDLAVEQKVLPCIRGCHD
jgi:hypothetical protein